MQVSASPVSSLSCIPFFFVTVVCSVVECYCTLLICPLLMNFLIVIMVFDLLHNVQIIFTSLICIDSEGVGSMAIL